MYIGVCLTAEAAQYGTMSTHTVQESCHCFWPQQPGDGDVHGKLRVSLKRLGSYGDITESRLEVVESGGRVSAPHRLVTLLQLSSWPPLGLPHPTAILSLVDLLSKAQRSSPGKHIIVMCRYVQCMCATGCLYKIKVLTLGEGH